MTDEARKLHANDVKHWGLAIRIPQEQEQAEALHEVSKEEAVDLVVALLLGGELDLASHCKCAKKAGSLACDL